MHPEAADLNRIIEQANPAVMELLSERGRNIYFPKRGILSQSAEAKGKKINATIGTALEDDGSPLCLSTIASKVSLPPAQIFPYAPSYGDPALRAEWKKLLPVKNPTLAGKPVSLPVVTIALTHGLSMLGYLFADEKTTIIMPDLYWENYDLVFSNAYGASFAQFPTFANGGFNVDGFVAAVKKSASKKKVILLNFPNNPSGYSPTHDEAKKIVTIVNEAAAAGDSIVLILDDAYFGLAFDDTVYPESLFSLTADLHERVLAVKVDGPTKEDYVWGFRVGFVTFGVKGGSDALYGALADKLAGAIRGNVSNAPMISQSLILQSLQSPDYAAQKQEKFNTLKKRCTLVKKVLAEHPEYKDCFEQLPFNSGYFMCIKLRSADSEKVRQRLLTQYSTGVIAFAGIIRVAFSATPTGKIEELFDNIYRACKDVG
ncbi:MAG: aminotransferase class I/II-fold pyridoxal phosphate-dependent enzyme [Spirochaetes bacterium]|nr:aminotransferase class I/II-fold pyridoxal phosphate-dependent enzyme [Spirochaetota bacterium]